MTFSSIGKTALTLTTGFGLKDFIKRHKMAAGLIIALVIANEIRGLVVVYHVVKAWWQ